ncbi:MAG: aminotransferase class V-fold PLP-dependent enzyme, partial [Hyphomicrobiales bacterium]
IVRNSAIRATAPTWPGGGSVSYVSPWAHSYLDSVIEREEAGTPNLIGDIRAALVFLVKAAVGPEFIAARDSELGNSALKVWRDNPNLRLLGTDKPNRLPIFSFAVRDGRRDYIHHQLFTTMLSDITGIQARGGCVCAGPYGHRLLNVGRERSEQIRHNILAGKEIEKPGWVRLNFSYLMDDATVTRIIKSVDSLATAAADYAGQYIADESSAHFSHSSTGLKATG